MGGKRISEWKQPDVQHLQDMAERGLVLVEMTHILYFYEERDPAYLRYRIEHLERMPSEEDRQALAEAGWQEVCHYELEYVFAAPRDPETPPDPLDELTAKRKKLEWEHEKERRDAKWGLVTAGIVLVFAVGLTLYDGIRIGSGFLLERLPLLLLLLLSSLLPLLRSRLRMQRLERQMEDPADDTTGNGHWYWIIGAIWLLLWIAVQIRT